MEDTTPRAMKRSFVDKLRPIGLVQEAMFSGRYSPAIAAQVDGLQDKFDLATETVDAIFEAADQVVWTEIPGTRVFKHASFMRRVVRNTLRASTPPGDGSCPFIDKLPAEIRRKILIDGLNVLPSRNLPIYPVCGGDPGGPSNRHQRPNALVDLMLLNKKIRDELAEAVYEERTFAIHVHPGFQDAGIEFLHVGRQPLQYLDHIGEGALLVNATQIRVHYKGDSDDFIVFAENAQAVQDWKKDRSIPLAQVVDSFKVFVTHK